MSLYRVRLYPQSDSGDPDDFFFTDKADAEAFASEVMNLPGDAADFLAGGEAPVLVYEVEPITLAQARENLAGWLDDDGWGEEAD